MSCCQPPREPNREFQDDNEQNIRVRHKEFDMPCYKLPLLDPNRIFPDIYKVPLNEKEHEIWLEFEEFDKGTAKLENTDDKYVEHGKVSIRLDHPIVLLIGHFAVTAFNKNWEMHIKKGEENHIHDFEFMECKYVRTDKAYYFFMTIEAIEEGNLGVYEAKVNCNIYDDVRLTLSKFILSNRTPIGGKKGMALSHLRSVYATAKGLQKDIKLYLKTAQKSSKGKKNGNRAHDLISLRKHRAKPVYLFKLSRMSQICGIGKKKGKRVAELICLKKENKKAMKDLHKVLPQDTWSPACNPMTNQADWNDPLEDHYSGLVCRRTTCWGYDFKNPHGEIMCRGLLQY